MNDSNDIRVLLVDDEETMLEFLSKRLLRDGFTVKAAFSGEEAVQAAAAKAYDVSVVDVNMAGMDGIETLGMLKDIRPEMQCIVLTGLHTPEDFLPEGEKNACSLLFKPVDFESLAQTIREVHNQGLKRRDEKKEQEKKPVHSARNRSKFKETFIKLKKLYGVENG